jgi:hypothetical protein
LRGNRFAGDYSSRRISASKEGAAKRIREILELDTHYVSTIVHSGE